MLQMDFFLNEDERIDFVKFALNKGCHLIPNAHYNDTHYPIITDFKGYMSDCLDTPLIFIIHKSYNYHPLELDYFEDNNLKKYFIKQRYGGPTIDFFSPIVGEKEDNVIGPGYVGIYPFYYNGTKKFVPNMKFKEMYKSFTSYIQTKAKKVALSRRIYWVGENTIQSAKKGTKKLLPISNNNVLELI